MVAVMCACVWGLPVLPSLSPRRRALRGPPASQANPPPRARRRQSLGTHSPPALQTLPPPIPSDTVATACAAASAAVALGAAPKGPTARALSLRVALSTDNASRGARRHDLFARPPPAIHAGASFTWHRLVPPDFLVAASRCPHHGR